MNPDVALGIGFGPVSIRKVWVAESGKQFHGHEVEQYRNGMGALRVDG